MSTFLPLKHFIPTEKKKSFLIETFLFLTFIFRPRANTDSERKKNNSWTRFKKKMFSQLRFFFLKKKIIFFQSDCRKKNNCHAFKIFFFFFLKKNSFLIYAGRHFRRKKNGGTKPSSLIFKFFQKKTFIGYFKTFSIKFWHMKIKKVFFFFHFIF